MIEETGIVKEVHNTTAKVIVQKRGTCDGCAASGVCETSGDGIEIEALNQANARAGQTVKVSIKPQAYLKGAIFVYGFPLVSFITGIILGKNIGETYFREMDSDLVAVTAGFAALFFSFLIARAWSRKAEAKTEYKPVIEEILE
jgi:sigma-E factor negative regulatory protein RseC